MGNKNSSHKNNPKKENFVDERNDNNNSNIIQSINNNNLDYEQSINFLKQRCKDNINTLKLDYDQKIKEIMDKYNKSKTDEYNEYNKRKQDYEVQYKKGIDNLPDKNKLQYEQKNKYQLNIQQNDFIYKEKNKNLEQNFSTLLNKIEEEFKNNKRNQFEKYINSKKQIIIKYQIKLAQTKTDKINS